MTDLMKISSLKAKTADEEIPAAVLEESLADFERRTGLPARASRSELEEKGARCFIGTANFLHNERLSRAEQMQKGDLSKGTGYFWKRIIPVNCHVDYQVDKQNPENTEKDIPLHEIPFQIHGEITPSGLRYYPYQRQ